MTTTVLPHKGDPELVHPDFSKFRPDVKFHELGSSQRLLERQGSPSISRAYGHPSYEASAESMEQELLFLDGPQIVLWLLPMGVHCPVSVGGQRVSFLS